MAEYRGYDPEKERPVELAAMAHEYSPVCGASDCAKIIDPRKVLPVFNQANWPSCGGHMTAHALMWIIYLATGKIIPLSRMFAWVEAQRFDDGRPSAGSGVSIFSCVKVLKELGVPLEELAPYKVGNFYAAFKPEVYDDAKERIVLHSFKLDTPDKVIDFAKAGMGAVLCGVPWEGGMRSWHAITILAWIDDIGIVANSWPKSADDYGEKDGFAEWTRKKLEFYFGFEGSVFYGISDLAEPQVRNMTWDDGGLVV